MKKQDYEEFDSERQHRDNGNMAAGISTAAGAAAGFNGANYVREKGNDGAVTDSEEPVADDTTVPTDVATTSAEPSNTAPSSASDVLSSSQNVQVVDYYTSTDGHGTPVDIATMRVDGHQAAVVDYGRTGEADVIAVDLNDNDRVDAGESIYVSGQHIAMDPLRDAANDNALADLMDDEGSDYVNDANVDNYLS